ncbi:MAG: ABC transporter substrate-binding protein [Roseburia sp.]|nr:ABC transporter substrate-binding protein [Roseburia sp.]MCM1280153.1 ABC transporter substrate-binding protein [Robinsoniella sp.]
MKKKVIALLLSMVVAANLMACSNTAEETTNPQELTESQEEEAAGAEGKMEEGASEQEEDTDNPAETTNVQLVEGSYTIGISQFAEHGSLDNCKEGFLAGLAEEGFVEGENLTVLFDNAQADTGTTSTIADNYVSQNVDLICGIATPSAMSAYNSTLNTEIPVIYTAVSDPVAAGLAEEDGTPVGNITGTSDYLAVTEQLQMIRDILPEATTIGIIYTTSETNSESTIAEYKKHAGEYGFEIVDTGINTIADVELAAANLVDKVDCITNLTDNTVVSALQTELAAANAKNIPVFGSEIEQVKSGCVASMGLEYYELGKQTGHMAAKVLKGEEKASDMHFETITEASLYVNTEAADKIGLALSEDFVKSAYQVFDTIVVE